VDVAFHFRVGGVNVDIDLSEAWHSARTEGDPSESAEQQQRSLFERSHVLAPP
jgi:hypothetical protein